MRKMKKKRWKLCNHEDDDNNDSENYKRKEVARLQF